MSIIKTVLNSSAYINDPYGFFLIRVFHWYIAF